MSSTHKKSKVKHTSQKDKQQNLSSAPTSPKNKHWLWAILIFCFATLLYANTYHHEWVLDDYGVIVNNIFVTQGTTGIHDILTHTYRYGSGFFTDNLYRPFSQIMFAFEWQLSPNNPTLFHIINILFYAISCVILFCFLRLLLGHKKWQLALITTLLFSAHPIHTEVVANIKGRDDIMALLFVLCSAITILKYMDTRKWIYLPLTFISFSLAMFSKESIITWFAVVPIMLYFFRDAKFKDYAIILTIITIPIGIYLYTRHLVLSAHDFGPFTVNVVDNFFYDEPLLTGWATAITLLGKYLIQLIVPYQMVCDYSFNQLPVTTFSDLKTWISLLIHIALLIYALRGIRQKSLISFGILFYIITMSIFSNLVYRIGSSFADRFLYMPSIGFCFAAGYLLNKLHQEKKRFSLKTQPLLCVILLLILSLYSGKTITRAAEWENQYKLFSTDVLHSDKSAHMRLYWGLALRDKGLDYYELNKFENDPNKRQENYSHYETWAWKAIDQFKQAISIYPKYADCYEQLGILYSRLAEFHTDRHYLDTAEQYYLKGLSYIPSKATMISNLAKLYFESNQIEKAKTYYLQAIYYDPRYADAYYNLGSTYGTLGKYDSSFYYYRKSLEIDPNRPEAYSFIGLNHYNLNQFDSAVIYYDKAIALEPRSFEMQYMKSVILYKAKRYEEALTSMKNAMHLSPTDAEAYYLMGLIEIQLGNQNNALNYFSQCISHNPQKLEAYYEKFKVFKERHQADSAQYYMNHLQQASNQNSTN